MTFDPRRNRIVLFGGYNSTFQTRFDVWEWDGMTWRDVTVTVGPTRRAGAGLVYHPIRERVLLYGGESALTHSDTWEWDGMTWTDVTSARRPPGRAHFALAWNGARQRPALYSGDAFLFSMFDDLWELDATGWTQVFSQAPAMRMATSASPTRNGDGMLVFGGMTATALSSQLWRWGWHSTAAYELCTLDADNDLDGLSGCADPDCWASCTPLCPPGTTCDPAWPRCGDGMCSGVEGCRLCPQDCTCTPACGDHFCDASETTASCPGDC